MTTPHRTTDNLDELMNDIRIEIPDAAEQIIEYNLRRAIIDFCRISHYWHEDVGPVNVIEGFDRYDLVSSGYTRIGTVIEVTTNLEGRDITLTNTKDPNIEYRYQRPSPFEIVIHPVDRLKGAQLSVICSLIPVVYQGSFEVSEEVIIRHHDALCDGAKGRLFRIPGKPWTNDREAVLCERRFNQAAKRGLREQARGYDDKDDGGKPYKPRSFM